MIFVALILMPLAAISVGGAGWVGAALESQGLISEVQPRDIFITVSKFVTRPGVYGFVIAAVVAALMSTLDTLITAVCAVVVNDVVRPLKPGMPDEYYLKIAKQTAVIVTIVGILLIPIFDKFKTIYQALSFGTSLIIPPLIIVLLFGILSKRFNSTCAIGTLLFGGATLAVSVVYPGIITPVAHGVDPSGGYSYMRGLFGLLTSGAAGFVLLMFAGGQEEDKLHGLTVHSLGHAMERFKGKAPNFKSSGERALASVMTGETEEPDLVSLPIAIAQELHVEPGDLLYITDTRWWTGGLYSVHARAAEAHSAEAMVMSEELFRQGGFRPDHPLKVEKLF